ncbi:MAG: hypothetical protein AAFV85_12040 [Cyanobacteria bacterium J06634_6]
MHSHFSSSSADSTAYSLEAEFEKIVQQKRGIGRLNGWFKQGLGSLLDFLTGQQTLSIRTEVLRDGTRRWTVYDPERNRRQVFYSQQAVRTWLEQRYYR